MKINKQIEKIIELIEDAKTIDDGKIGFALIGLYSLKKDLDAEARDGEKLKKVYQCGDCGAICNKKNDGCCIGSELVESYQCGKCGMLFAENWKHICEKFASNKENGK